jgi:hypothetical protein
MSENINKRIFTNINHLKSTIKTFGSTVFTDVALSDNMMKFIINNFITSQFLKNGKIFGDIATPEYINIKESEKFFASKQKSTLDEFLKLLVTDHLDQTIQEPLDNQNVYGSGSYGTITQLNINGIVAKDRLVKFMKFDHNDIIAHELSIHPDVPTSDNRLISQHKHIRELYMWMIEFCAFVVIMSILTFVDTLVDISDSNNSISRQNHIFEYRHMFARLCKPFIKKTSSGHFVIGYIMVQYDKTIEQILDNTKKDLHSSIFVIIQSVVILRNLLRLSEFGVYISHRDTTTRNIMSHKSGDNLASSTIKLIDFGFLCAKIKFRDNNDISIGYHPFDTRFRLDTCDKRHLDIILFISWCIRHCNTALNTFQKASGIDIKTKFINIVTLNNQELLAMFNKKKKTDYYYSPWEYSSGLDQFVTKLIINNKIDRSKSLVHSTDHHDRVNLIFDEILHVIADVVNKLSDQNITDSRISTSLNVDNTNIDSVKSGNYSQISMQSQIEQIESIIVPDSTNVNIRTIKNFTLCELYEHNKCMYLKLYSR